MIFTGTIIGPAAVLASLDRAQARTLIGVHNGLRETAELGVGVVRSYLGGSPVGYRSGQYWDSWKFDSTFDPPGKISARVYSNAPQAWRLEKGYRGPDSLGRTFNQGPRPHVLPAATEMVEVAQAVVPRHVKAALG